MSTIACCSCLQELVSRDIHKYKFVAMYNQRDDSSLRTCIAISLSLSLLADTPWVWQRDWTTSSKREYSSNQRQREREVENRERREERVRKLYRGWKSENKRELDLSSYTPCVPKVSDHKSSPPGSSRFSLALPIFLWGSSISRNAAILPRVNEPNDSAHPFPSLSCPKITYTYIREL